MLKGDAIVSIMPQAENAVATIGKCGVDNQIIFKDRNISWGRYKKPCFWSLRKTLAAYGHKRAAEFLGGLKKLLDEFNVLAGIIGSIIILAWII